jgi:hypothetical protein
MHQAMQHSNLYALEGFGLTESSENAGASEAFATGEWFTVEREDGGEARIRLSGPRVQLERHLVPAQVEIKTGGEGELEIYARVEVNEGGSKLAEICFVSTDPDARGIRQTDLREVEVSALLEDLVALFTIGYGLVPYTSERGVDTHKLEIYGGQLRDGEIDPAFLRVARGLRRGRKRDITPALLERVAEIYRANISTAPTKAVEHHFQVSQRMAAEYVSRARTAGLLPATRRGKKQA